MDRREYFFKKSFATLMQREKNPGVTMMRLTGLETRISANVIVFMTGFF
jgi:hypothetical protein